ncbi:pyocin activator PrtN family protein [Pseudomonas sp. RIT411]|uniref:pyocin activator PrtN family protein n=1 Tax=Pseudomonas sp. RIT411 TaxID=2202160 RepID=UPI000D3C904C|nr:pyocin activator PrtN family protein [Pseudomonas sp. RIT 411]RAU31997.1 Pyocin activator protein PrtN [Pseudomonas sp. RIT 411]
MNTTFLLMAQYGGVAVIPLERLCTDYFSHLTPTKLRSKIVAGVIDLPLVRIEDSQKAAQGVHLTDLARYLDVQRERAVIENDKLHNRAR